MIQTHRIPAIVMSFLVIGSMLAIGGVTEVQAQSTVDVTMDGPGTELSGSETIHLVGEGVDDDVGVGAYQVNITYNSSLVSLSIADTDRFITAHDTAKTSDSMVTETIVGYTGKTNTTPDTVKLASIELTAVDGTVGNTTEVKIDEVDKFSDVDGNDLTSAIVQPGSFEITEVDEDAPDDDGPGPDPSPSGGGGDDAPADAPEPRVADTPADIQNILPKEVEIADDADPTRAEVNDIMVNPDTGTSSVTFSEESTVESIEMDGEVDGQVSVIELSQEPDSTGPAPGQSVSVTQIDVPEQARNSPATIRNRIPRDRVDEIDDGPQALTVMRYEDEAGEWQTLETEVIEVTDDVIRLEAETPGFSYFAVAALQDEEVTTATEEPTTTVAPTKTEAPTTTARPTTEEPADEGGPGALLIGGILVVVLALLAALYFVYGRE